MFGCFRVQFLAIKPAHEIFVSPVQLSRIYAQLTTYSNLHRRRHEVPRGARPVWVHVIRHTPERADRNVTGKERILLLDDGCRGYAEGMVYFLRRLHQSNLPVLG